MANVTGSSKNILPNAMARHRAGTSGSVVHCYAYSDFYSDIHPNSNPDAHADSNPDAHKYSHPNIHAQPNGHHFADISTFSHTFSDADFDDKGTGHKHANPLKQAGASAFLVRPRCGTAVKHLDAI